MKLGIFHCVNLKCYIIALFHNKSESTYIYYMNTCIHESYWAILAQYRFI